MRPRNRVVIVGRDLDKAQICVQRTCRFHVIEGVEQHAVVAGSARCIQHGFSELATQAKASERLANIQALHLSSIGIVHCMKRTQGAAAGQLAIDPGQQQSPQRCIVVARQVFQLGSEILKAQVHTQLQGVFRKDLTRERQLISRAGRPEFDGG